MIMCRICLSDQAPKKLTDLNEDVRDTNYTEVFLFCLGIEVNDCKNITQCLCGICYEKLLEFYEFKQHALKNNKYLQSLKSELKDVKLESGCSVKLENFEVAVADVKHEDEIVALRVKSEGSEDHNTGDLANLGDPGDPGDPSDPDDPDDSEDEVLSVVRCQKLEAEAKKKSAKAKARGKLPPKRVCEQCGRAVRDLRAHARVHLPPRPRAPPALACPHCARAFHSYGGRRKHVLNTHGGAKQACPLCHKVVQCLRTHTATTHDRALLRHACASCPRRFVSPSALAAHARAHSGDRPFACDACGKRFRTGLTLDCHKRSVHEQERSFLCQYCPKSFFKKYHLNLHVRSHTQERPYKCEECGRRFSSSTVLAQHRSLHADARPHGCPHCDRMFKNTTQLYNHLKSHATVRQHACAYCPARFKRSDHRARHETTAHLRHAGLKRGVQGAGGEGVASS